MNTATGVEVKQGFGHISDSSDQLKSKAVARGEFGLNKGSIIKFEYTNEAGKDGGPGDAIDVWAKVEDAEYRLRLFDITKVFDKNNNEIDETHPDYIKIYNANLAQLRGVVTHVVKALGVTEEQIAAALATPPTSFAQWAQIMTAIVGDNIELRPVDIFLEYQWNIGPKAKMTYLQLPKNMKGGRFLCVHVPTATPWEAKTTDEGGLVYTNGVVEHPFTKDKNFMTSNKAIQQKEGETSTAGASALGTPGEAKSNSWG
jgi:hypothetical protein